MTRTRPPARARCRPFPLAMAVALLAFLVCAVPASAQGTTPHEFVYVSAEPLRSVQLAGTFNNWDRTASPMTPDAAGKTWRLSLRLPYGKHLYKFVLNGDTWVTDPANRQTETDDSGNRNSVLLLAPSDYAHPASPFDGVTARSALLHPASVPYLNYDRGRLTLSLRARPGDLRQVWLELGRRRVPMAVTTDDGLYAFYSASLAWDRRADLSYMFELQDGPKTLGYGANGAGAPGKVRPFVLRARTYQPFAVPGWVERSVIYQIFPDRFANGDRSNDPPDVQPWNAAPTGSSRFGGDVQGVRQHLPYLASLGVSAVYFTPVYRSPSNHRYDVEDYKAVDPEFGTNAQFAALSRDLRSHGIRTVMDFVFNHSSATFPPFEDVRQKGAASKYRDWYFIRSYPVHAAQPPNYAAFGNWWGMPKLNMANPAVQDYMLGVVRFWKRTLPLAGLRLDVADEVDMGFWRRLRKQVKALDPGIWIVGERWGDASRWLGGDQWDAAMNYPFLFASVDFFAEGRTTASQYTRRLMALYRSYLPQVSRNMMNMLSTHDTPRFLTRCANNQDLDRLAATVQFTWVGAPSVYYGEELGMQGGADPDNRRGMAWDLARPDNPMLRYYRRLIRLRSRSRALQSGDPAILMADDARRSFAYSRTFGSEAAIVAVNRSDRAQTLRIPLPRGKAMQAALKHGLVDGLTGKRVPVGKARKLSVTLGPLHAAVLLPAGRPSAL